jgi:hypothetical protein
MRHSTRRNIDIQLYLTKLGWNNLVAVRRDLHRRHFLFIYLKTILVLTPRLNIRKIGIHVGRFQSLELMIYSDGLVGPIIVHSPNETVPEYDQDIIVQLSDVYNTWSPTLLAGYLAVSFHTRVCIICLLEDFNLASQDDDVEVASEPVPDAGTINGIGQFSACYAFPNQSCDGQGSYFNFSLAANKTCVRWSNVRFSH